MADHERNLISRILISGELRDVLDRKVTEEMFVDDRNRAVFSYVMNYYKKYGELPTLEVIEESFPDYEMPHVREPLPYCIDRVVECYIRNKGSDILLRNAEKLLREPLSGLDTIRKDFSRLTLDAVPTEDANLLETIDKRKQKYLDLKNMKGIDGYPSPWGVLNACTMGWHPEDFVVIVSRPKIGKTWMLTIFGHYAWENNLSALFISNEMATQQIERRFDAVNFQLPYNELRSGLLPTPFEEKYFKGLEELSQLDRPPMWTIGNIGGVSAIGAKIDEYKPDIVLVDGMYLLPDDRRGGNRWERTSNVSRDLKLLAKQKKIPIIATTQFNRTVEGVKFDEVTLGMLGFSDSIGQDADVVIGLFSNKDMNLNRELYVRLLALREGEPKDFVLSWDFHRMNFEVLREDSDDEVIEDDEIDVGEIDF